MKSNLFRKRISAVLAAAALSALTSQSAIAAPGTLSTAPLFVSTLVEPNIFFSFDDSGSMNWEALVKNGTGGFFATSGLPLVGNYFRYYYNPDWHNNRQIMPPSAGQNTTWVNNIWIFRNSVGNKSYYDPSIKYVPWAGSKIDGTPLYSDADPLKALFDPDEPTGASTNLTVAKDFYDYDDCLCYLNGSVYLPTYYTWTDTNANGQIDPSDAHQEVKILAGSAEMQNFANWFVYYRNREYAAKGAIGRVINNTDATRMGLDIFNGGTKINTVTMTDPANKRAMLKEFYAAVSAGGTPTRNAIKRMGGLFERTTANSPILSAALGGECQQNFSILVTDGFWNGANPANIGNADGDNNTPFDGDDGRSGLASFNSNDGGNYADASSRTLADTMMHYYEHDLRPDLADKVPTIAGVDEAAHQHLVGYTISFGLSGTLDSTTVDPTAPGFQWPDAHLGDSEKVDDLWHAAYNARGKYLSAQNPGELEQALNESIADIAERTATAAAVSINSSKLTTESVVYLAQFNTNRWQGDLFAFRIADLNTGALAPTADWAASSELTSRNFTSNPRVLLTHDGTDGVPFKWDSLSLLQKNDLRTNPAGTFDIDDIAKARLEYLRGDRSNEANGYFFRQRASLLGDLVNAGPVFTGAPDLSLPDTAPFPTAKGTRYSDYKSGPAKTRAGVVYAGANDGMLHGFDEKTGKEVLAYIPGNLFSTTRDQGLHYLTDPNYRHRYYNDLTPTVSDIYADIGGGLKWNTVLVSGQRAGGRGIYALDVTNPALFSNANAANLALWEFTHPDLGFTFSRPQIGLMNDKSWVAIFGNGYNDTGDGQAKLYIVKIDKGVDGNWAASDYKIITTGSGSTTDRNGLATPALADLDGNGTIDRAYAGDLKGQMWAFDLNDVIPANWGVNLLFTAKGTGPGGKIPRPITAQPTLARHPTVSTTSTNEPNIMVFFGTGQYLVDVDRAAPYYDDNFYGVWDKGVNNLKSTNLVEQTYDTSFGSNRVLTNNTVDYNLNDFGWYLGLPATGERSITPSVVRGTVVFFNTFVPSEDPCTVGGFGFRFAVNLVNGGATEEAETDINNDGYVDVKDKVSNGATVSTVSAIKQDGFLPEPVFIEDIAFTADTPAKVRKLPKIPKGRLSWQELIQ